jgi:PAS domain S-box-containing protein
MLFRLWFKNGTNMDQKAIVQSDPATGVFKPWQAYLVATVTTVATLCLRLALDGQLREQPTLVIFAMPIMLSAYLGGLRGGLLATGLTYVLASYFLLPPLHTFRIAITAHRWDIFFVTAGGVVISVLNEALHRARRRANIATRDRQQAEESLQKAGALQNAIFSSANFSCIATDTKGVIQLFNVGAERMMGYMAAEVLNKMSPTDFHDPPEVSARAKVLSLELGQPIASGFEALACKASRGIEDIYELTKIRKDGSHFPALVSVTALRDGEGGIIGYLLIGTDNTTRQQAEEERKRFASALRETNVMLESAKSAAEKANLAKSEFLSNMSHELRTPLNAILGFAQLMEAASPSPTPSQAKRITQILQAGWYLLKLINEVLDLAVIESGKLSLSKEPVLLSEVMSECQTMMEPQAQQRGIGMSFPQFDRPVYVRADRTRLKQIIINLVSNAIKYNKEQGTVVVGCAASGPDIIRISVKDTGAGLSPEKMAQLFSPFNRLGQETGSVAGTGIGLVVSKRLAELMGGGIGVESTVGVGSVFWCELLSAEPPRAELQSSAAEALVQPEASTDTPTRALLYVEDNPANMELVEQIIEQFPNLKLVTAVNGTLGIELARATKPEVILMDINLPGINGFKALKILRGDFATAHIPVIALSATAMARDIEKGLEAGFFRYLTKPIQIKEFMDTLNEALEFAENQLVEAIEAEATP